MIIPFRRMEQKFSPRVALIDMDGVLYNSMIYHTLAWKRMMANHGFDIDRDEFYAFEGMTGKDTINLIMERYGRHLSPEQIKELYLEKTELFLSFPKPDVMEGAKEMLAALKVASITCVVVTGSGQNSLISRIDADFPGVFELRHRVTAADVVHGKPNPEPYLKGLEKSGYDAKEAIVIENAPLGVEAGHKAGCFTIGVATGPIGEKSFCKAGADLFFPSMPAFAAELPLLLANGFCRK